MASSGTRQRQRRQRTNQRGAYLAGISNEYSARPTANLTRRPKGWETASSKYCRDRSRLTEKNQPHPAGGTYTLLRTAWRPLLHKAEACACTSYLTIRARCSVTEIMTPSSSGCGIAAMIH